MSRKYIIDNIEFDSKIVMEMFEEVFCYIGSFILGENDEKIEGLIYEEYDSCAATGLIDFKLDILLDNNFITKEIKLKAQEMRILSDKMFGEDMERSASFIRTSPEWQKIIALADEIKSFLDAQNNK